MSHQEKTKINKKYLYIFLAIIAFFVIQFGIIYYANFLFKGKICPVENLQENSSSINSFLYRIDQRISNLQSEINYLRGYILSTNKE